MQTAARAIFFLFFGLLVTTVISGCDNMRMFGGGNGFLGEGGTSGTGTGDPGQGGPHGPHGNGESYGVIKYYWSYPGYSCRPRDGSAPIPSYRNALELGFDSQHHLTAATSLGDACSIKSTALNPASVELVAYGDQFAGFHDGIYQARESEPLPTSDFAEAWCNPLVDVPETRLDLVIQTPSAQRATRTGDIFLSAFGKNESAHFEPITRTDAANQITYTASGLFLIVDTSAPSADDGDKYSATLQASVNGKNVAYPVLCRLTPNNTAHLLTSSSGSIDRTFGDRGRAVSLIWPNAQTFKAMALQSDGKIVVVGEYPGPPAAIALTRLNADGSQDYSFASNLYYPGSGSTTALAVAVQQDGKILVGGQSGGPDAASEMFVMRFLTTGSIDTTFGAAGTAWVHRNGSTETMGAFLLSSTQKIIIAADSISQFGNNRVLVQLQMNGQIDATFASQGYATLSSALTHASAIVEDRNGHILVGGTSNTGSSTILRILPDSGILVIGMNYPRLTEITTIRVQPDGKILLAGSFATNETRYPAFARLSSNGVPDTLFGASAGEMILSAYSTNGTVSGLQVLGDGTIGAIIHSEDQGRAFATLMRFTSSGTINPSFGTAGVVTTSVGLAGDWMQPLLVDSAGNFLVGGTSNVNGPKFSVARYLP